VTSDPALYSGAAAHYLRGRPPYSAELVETLRREVGLDGHGTLVDVGCGPGTLAVELSAVFDRVVGIDPDRDMLREAERHAVARERRNIEWRHAYADDLGALGLSPARVVTFGQSFHWTRRHLVADAVYDLLTPGGSLVLVAHDIDARRAPPGPGDPPIPDDEVQDLIATYLGPGYKERHRNPLWDPSDRYEPALAASRFGHARTVHAPGREDLTRDIDGVVSGYLSMSYAAPARFGVDLDRFIRDLRALLAAHTPTGRFWDWPGDTALIIATKPA
jgi:SAM-dependent methyltransferase